jgi:chorismate mutase/prephenate dehydrogenase
MEVKMNECEESVYQSKLSELRIQLNTIDDDLIKLLISRFSLTDEIGRLKQNSNQQIYDPNREASIFDNISETIQKKQLSSTDLDRLTSCIIEIYREIMNQSKISQSNL